MKRYMKKGIAISLSAMLVFEMFSVLPVHFVSYARVGEEEISNVEIMESGEEIKSEEDNENVSRSSESDFDILYFDTNSALLMAYHGNDEIVVIPEEIVSINDRAFRGNANIKKVILPEGLGYIGEDAFRWCSNLTELTLPEGLRYIGNHAFADCTNLTLTKITLPKELKEIGDYAFSGCSNLTELTLPEGLESIGWGAFTNCTNLTLTEGMLPQKLSYIWLGTFSGCKNLIEIKLPERIKVIKESAFYYCTSLKKVNLPEGLERIEWDAFQGCSSLTELTLPEGLTSIEDRAFQGCSSLIELTLPEGLTSIEDSVFQGCSSLIELTLPEGLTSIGNRAFSNCSNLTELILPEGIKDIKDEAFKGCKNLRKVTFPKGTINIDYMAFDKYNWNPNLTIYCYAGSDAEKYAKMKKIPYQLIDNGDEEETLVSSFSMDSTAMGTLDSTIMVKGTLVLKDDVETSSSILSSEVEKIFLTSSDSSIAEVTDWSSESEEDNRKAALQICVTPYQEGRVTITGKTSNGLTASCKVVISKAEEVEEKEASVTLEIGENAEIYVKGEGKVRDSVTITGSAWEIEGKIYTTLEELEKKCDTPERDSYRFEGWELEGKKLSKNSPILDGSRLSAVWIKVKNDSENNNNNSSSSSSSGSKTKGNRIINEDTAGCYNLSKTEIFSLSQGISLILGKDTQIGLVIKNEEGIMAVSEEGDIVLRKNSGSMAEKEWMFVEGTWYYFGSDRKAVSGWIQNEGGKWYYLNPESKKMETGWVEMADGKWYYLDKENGEMRTGWQRMEEGDWYFMNPKTGEMMTGWICIEEKYYYLDEMGVCAMNTVTPDGYRVDETGMWIK